LLRDHIEARLPEKQQGAPQTKFLAYLYFVAASFRITQIASHCPVQL
jgi:hypothetical protein